MKATLEFNLPDERFEHIRAVHASAAWACLDDLDLTLRNAVKYGCEFKTLDELATHLRREIGEVRRLIEE